LGLLKKDFFSNRTCRRCGISLRNNFEDHYSNKKEDARHYNQIGWLITSFFLIFLGTIFSSLIGWTNNAGSIDKDISVSIIILIMFFGFIVARLFLRSQMRKMKIYGKENDFYNISIWSYIAFILIIEIILVTILSEISQLTLGLLIILVFFIMGFILIETKSMHN